MKGIEIAKAYGVTPAYVSKWSPERKAEAIRNLQAGVNPIIAELVGELQRECYVAMKHKDDYIGLHVGFEVFRVETGIGEYRDVFVHGQLNPYELQGAIVKVKELYSHV